MNTEYTLCDYSSENIKLLTGMFDTLCECHKAFR
jgi:hypothetical protein